MDDNYIKAGIEATLRPKHEDGIDQSRKNGGNRNIKVVLDNAQGYGYKTKQKAMAAWNYKNRDTSKDSAKREKERKVKDWMKHHKGFVNTMERYCFEIEYKRSWASEDKFDDYAAAHS